MPYQNDELDLAGHVWYDDYDLGDWMLLHGHVPRHSFDYKHNQTFYSNVDSKMEVREYVSSFPFLKQ